MGIMVSKDESNTELDRRITADLRAKAQSSKRVDVDGVNDSTYIENTKQTSHFSWIWILLIALAVIALVCIILV